MNRRRKKLRSINGLIGVTRYKNNLELYPIYFCRLQAELSPAVRFNILKSNLENKFPLCATFLKNFKSGQSKSLSGKKKRIIIYFSQIVLTTV